MSTSRSRLYQYGHSVNTHDLIKVVAITLMIVDHLGFYFLDNNLALRLLGRGAAPLFYFLIGYAGKLNCRPSLFVYATILSLTSTFLSGKYFWANILFTFLIAHFILTKLPVKKMPNWLTTCLVLSLMLLNTWIYAYIEYGTLGILISLSVYWHKEKPGYAGLWLAFITIYYFLWQGLTFHLFNATWSIYGLVIIGSFCLLLFYYYKLEKIYSYPKWLIKPTLIISRYSLEIYFFHLIIFQLIYFIRRSNLLFSF